jgi:hypothetical protein
MKITVGVGDGIPKQEVCITYMSVDLINTKTVSIAYETGSMVDRITITIPLAIEIGLLNFEVLEKVLK